MDSKICSVCKIEKPIVEFYQQLKRYKAKISFIYRGECKKCKIQKDSKRQKFSRKEHREHGLVYDGHKKKKQTPDQYLNSIKSRAKRKNLEFNLTEDDIKSLPKYCPVLGIRISRKNKNRDRLISIDRIENSKGYTKDNIIFVSNRVNQAKRDLTFKELEKIYLFYKRLLNDKR